MMTHHDESNLGRKRFIPVYKSIAEGSQDKHSRWEPDAEDIKEADLWLSLCPMLSYLAYTA